MTTNPRKIVAIEHLSLDGVYQAPARDDEDPRGGFEHGGWSAAGNAPEMQSVIGRYMAAGWSLLAGTTTYEDLYEGWQKRQPSNPMTKALADVQKFVVTHRTHYELMWKNSTLVPGEAADTVPKLKADEQKPLIIFGSGELVRSLMRNKLVDELVLMIHPLVLGQGRRLFDTAAYSALTLADKVITPTGVIMGIYHPQ